MAGLLDSKKRFVDTVITAEGRRQLAAGGFQVRFVTFTDKDVFYGKDTASGSIDQSELIQLEAPSMLPNDVITLESNLFGNVVADVVSGVSSSNGQPLSVLDGRLVQFTSASKNVITGSEYQSLMKEILNSSLTNFKSLETIATLDPYLDDQNLKISTNTINFEIRNDNIDSFCALPDAEIDRDAESIDQDRHLSHLANYAYLPPRNKVKSRKDELGSLLAIYPNNSQADIVTLEDYEKEVRFLPRRDIEFNNTSLNNNLVCQIYDTSGDFITPLKAIDFGEFATGDPERPTKRVFFVGKLFSPATNKNKTAVYVNMFTLEFD
jgi:hypothetical protein